MRRDDWLAARAARTPGREALVWGRTRLDFAALAERAAGLAGAFARAGIGRDALVAARLRDPVAFASAMYGTWGLGARWLPVNARLAAPERARVRAAARPALWIEGEEALPVARPGAPAAPPGDRFPPGAIAVVLFTSGTTGRPRGACLTRDNLYWSAVASAARLGSTSEDRWLACLPLFHVGGLSILVRSVLYGTAVVVQERFDPARVSRALDEEGITLLSLVPTTLKRLLEARPGRAPDRLRAVLLGGAAAPEGLVRRARDRGYPVLPTYGLTEAASQVATVRPGAEPRGAATPLVGTSVRVVDAGRRRLPPDEPGAVEVRGPTVFAGYLEDPEATRAALRDGWLATGDVGVVDAAGGLRLLDRRTDLVLTGGENVYPAEVEAVLLDHPGVEEVAVVGLPDPDLGQRVAAFVVARGDARDAARLDRFCRARLAGYKRPREIRFVAALPRNAMGKVVRASLGASPGPGDGISGSGEDRAAAPAAGGAT